MAVKKQKKQFKNPVPVKESKKTLETGKAGYLVYLAAILLVTFFIYMPGLKNGFVWDDEGYLQINEGVRHIDLKKIFSENVMGNYHPLTMLLYTIQYHFFQLNPIIYHLVNLLIHLANTALVFFVIRKLTNTAPVALITSLLFGIHPIHVESVVWASELKDLLYTFFFLASWLSYLSYIQSNKQKYILFSIALFLFSLLSKAMAASLPVVLILTDYMKGRKMKAAAWLEKLPFFLLSLLFGYIAIRSQQSAGATDVQHYPFTYRIVFACYSINAYLFKLVMPLLLSPFYGYPIVAGGTLPAYYYLFPLIVLILTGIIIYSIRQSKDIVFGTGFFLVTIFLVLQLLPVGNAIMADRYMYIPSIGIFYIVGQGLYILWSSQSWAKRRLLLGILSFVIVIIYASKTYAQVQLWKNGYTLWNHVIEKYPPVALAYHNRGLYYVDRQRDEEAINDFTKAIQLSPDYVDVYNNRGLRYENLGRYEEALKDYDVVIRLKPDHAKAYANRGNVLNLLGRYKEAINDLSRSITINPSIAEPYNNRGAVYMKDSTTYNLAMDDFNKALHIKADYVDAYNNRALLFMYEKKYDEALKDFDTAITLKPGFVKAYFNKGIVLNQMKRYTEAINEFDKAIDLQPGYAEAYNTKGTVLMNEKKFDEAYRSFSKAIEIQPGYASAYYNRGVSEFDLGKMDLACKDFQQAASLGHAGAASTFNNFCH